MENPDESAYEDQVSEASDISSGFQIGFEPMNDVNQQFNPLHDTTTPGTYISDSHNMMASSFPSLTNSLEQKMATHLPPYVVNCFLAAGFDTAEVIAEMNISKSGNSLQTIVNYINEQCPNNPMFTHMGNKVCKFPPGHKLRIKKFIEQIRNELKNKPGSDQQKRTLKIAYYL